MANKPFVLMVRFLMEIFGLLAFGYFGWQTGNEVMRFVLAGSLPLIAAIIWGTFRVPNDPGTAPIAVPGWLRLTIELFFFSSAAFLFYMAGSTTTAIIFAIIFILLYIVSYDRVIWLIKQN